MVKVGNVIGRDEIYIGNAKEPDKKIVNPLPVARYISTGSFYGRGFVGSQMGIHYEVEKMLANQFQNVADLDAFPFIVIPSTSGLTKKQVLKKERRKVLFSDPDPLNPNAVPFKIDPYSSGDFPGRIAQMGIGLADKLSGQGDIFNGEVPGRVDSAAALGFLFETGNVNVLATVNDISDAYSLLYASFLQAAKQEVEKQGVEEGEDGPSFKLPILDDRIIGVVFDPATGTVSLAKNPVPEPWQVKIDVAERALQSPSQAKQEAMLMLVNGIIDITMFRILNEKEGWGYPIGNRSDWEAWRKAVLQKILLYNDGETPGQIIGGSEYDRPDIVLPVIEEMTSSVEFMVASEDVRNAFIEWKERFEQIGPNFPDQLSLDQGAASVGINPGQAAGAA